MLAWLALGSVWVGVASLVLAGTMLVFRPAMTDLTVVAVLYFGSPGALCFGGMVLWAHWNQGTADPAIEPQRLQAKVGIALAILAAAVVYALIINSHKLDPV